MRNLFLLMVVFSSPVFANEQSNIHQTHSIKIEQEQKIKQQKAFQEGIEFAKESEVKITQKQAYKDGEKFAKEMCDQYPNMQCNIKKP